MKRIPDDAFAQYLQLGDGRSYQALATRWGISKRSIVQKASKDGWQKQLREIQTTARERAVTQLGEEFASVQLRHLKAVRAIQGKALQALNAKPINNAMDAVRALTIAQREERSLYSAAHGQSDAPPNDGCDPADAKPDSN